MKRAHLLAFVIGLLSLSQEIAWMRLTAFAYQTLPQAFAFTLAFFLVGVAFGAAYGKQLCARSNDLWRSSARVLLLAAAADLLLPLCFAGLNREVMSVGMLLPLLALSVALTAGLKSVLFPITHHLGSLDAEQQLGRSVSLTYFSNILGSTLGPLITGFILLDVLSLQQTFCLIACATACGAWLCRPKGQRMILGTAGMLGAVLLTSVLLPARFLVESLAIGTGDLGFVDESRHGIVHTRIDPVRGDVVHGGNVYDGRMNLSLLSNGNLIHRAYFAATFHARPRRVLMIGLSSGSWAKVVRGYPGLEHLDIVEINPAYLRLIDGQADHRSILSDDRIHLHIDDGRRWLNAHPQARYDMIVMNTSFHWRAQVDSLLSIEFMRIMKQHLNPGGAVFFNATGSLHVWNTAAHAYRHAYRYSNFIAASDEDLRQRSAALLERIDAIVIDDTRLDARPDLWSAEKSAWVKSLPLEALEETIGTSAAESLEVITDQNVLTEYRYGKSLVGL